MSELIIPNQKLVERSIKSFFNLFFPEAQLFADYEIDINEQTIQEKLDLILSGLTDNGRKITQKFFEDIENIKEILLNDANYMLESDPAANSRMEVISLYPGFYALFCYRIAHYLIKHNIPLLPRMITEYAHRRTGIDIHPAATIGSPISIDHGTGIVIGGTTVIGNFVKIFQGVTLGALSLDKSKSSTKRHPTVEDNVILYAGCTILGGDTVIGNNSIIGGNVWLTDSIDPFSVVYHKSEVIIRNLNGAGNL